MSLRSPLCAANRTNGRTSFVISHCRPQRIGAGYSLRTKESTVSARWLRQGLTLRRRVRLLHVLRGQLVRVEDVLALQHHLILSHRFVAFSERVQRLAHMQVRQRDQSLI